MREESGLTGVPSFRLCVTDRGGRGGATPVGAKEAADGCHATET